MFIATKRHLCAPPTKPRFLEQRAHLRTIATLASCSLHLSVAALNIWWHPEFKMTSSRTCIRQYKRAPYYLTSVLEVATCISFLISDSQKLLQEPESTVIVLTCIQFNYIFLGLLEFKSLGHTSYFVGQDALLQSFYRISNLFHYFAILVLSSKWS